jgi:hypothetical protein
MIIGDQDENDHDEQRKIAPMNPRPKPMGEENEARLEMNKDQVEKDQSQIDDLSFEVLHPPRHFRLQRLASPPRFWRPDKKDFGQMQKGKKEEDLGNRIDKEGQRSLDPEIMALPEAQP